METAGKKDVTIETKLIRIFRTEARKHNLWQNFVTTNAKASPTKNGGWQYNLKIDAPYNYYRGPKDDPRLKAFDILSGLVGFHSSWRLKGHELPVNQDKPWAFELRNMKEDNKSVDDLLLPAQTDDDDEGVKALRAKIAARRAAKKASPEVKRTYVWLSKIDLSPFKIDHLEVNGESMTLQEFGSYNAATNKVRVVMKPFDVAAAKKAAAKDATPLQQVIFNSIEEFRKNEATFGKFLGIRFAKEELTNPTKAVDVEIVGDDGYRGGSGTYYFTFASMPGVKATLAARPTEVFKAMEKVVKAEAQEQGLKANTTWTRPGDEGKEIDFSKNFNHDPNQFILAPIDYMHYSHRGKMDVKPFISKPNLAAFKEKLEAGSYGRPFTIRIGKLKSLSDGDSFGNKDLENVIVLVIELK